MKIRSFYFFLVRDEHRAWNERGKEAIKEVPSLILSFGMFIIAVLNFYDKN
ncbi:putative holin-like toxin [Neobacillus drentensis]|jgi:hypothetical protein|uniref:putative holin-like toxin n=1 Tax=Neobacillus drentensis TaxID=220684 RepID=UPI0026872891